MTRPQRIIAIIYCFLVLYCCLWIPLRVFQQVNPDGSVISTSLGYGWLWSAETLDLPSIHLIVLRLLASTALGAAAFLLAGKWKSS
jgi:TRAP-type C4-dicarboxylate transport system permease small subunit